MAATKRQQEAILLHDRSMVVTAGAGTGKTFVLVEKYLDLIEKRGLHLREVLALTFTDKAATEMKERVRETIIRRQESSPESKVWKAAAEEVMIAPIMTFHSFCSQILREFAIEAGLEPGFVILDDGQAITIRKDAFDALIHHPPDSVHESLVRLLAQSDKFRLQEMVSAISQDYLHYQKFFADLNDPPELIRRWKQYLDEIRIPAIKEFFDDADCTEAIDDLLMFHRMYLDDQDTAVRYLKQVALYLSDLSRNTSEERLSQAANGFLSVRPKGKIGSQKVWDREDLARFRSAKSYLIRRLEQASPYFSLSLDADSRFTETTLSFFADIAAVAEVYISDVKRLKRQISGIDFGDLIFFTREFLQNNPDIVERHIRPRYRYIFVDEYQDTDPSQFAIITAIIGQLTPNTNGLFIVGDPKQSIYLFRNADVTRFKEAQQRILADCSGRLVNLDISFRSSREVIAFVNYLFGALFASSKKPWEFGYEPISVCDERRSARGSVQILFPEKAPKGSSTTEHKEIEAGMVADMVHRIVSCQDWMISERDGTVRSAGYGDIAILLERRTHLVQYMNALNRQDAPFYVHGGIGFYTRQEIYDLYSILSFLLRPYDDAALFGLLRSPYFCLSDTLIFKIQTMKGFRHRSTLFEKIRHYADSSGETEVRHVVHLLDQWLGSAGRIPVTHLINQIIRDSGVLCVYGALPIGEQQVANLDKLIQIARGRVQSGNYGLSDLVGDMAKSIDEEEREGEAALDTLSKTSVNIMTVHAAKGLEFPIVILPDMGSSREGKLPSLLSGDEPYLVGMKIPNPDNGYEIEGTPIYQALSLIRKEKEAAERRRLFYVGTTRARDHLILCGKQPDKMIDTIDESNNRIDWVCTLLGITKENFESGESVWFDPHDGEGKIEVRIVVDPDQLTREWASVQPSLLSPPEELLSQAGRWKEKQALSPVPTKVWNVSEIIRRLDIPASPSEPFCIPDADWVGSDVAGTILHQILSGKNPGIVLQEHGIRSQAAIEWSRTVCEKFFQLTEMQMIDEDYCELSFVTRIGEFTLEGRMDRLSRNKDGWMVIDYKSGAGRGVEFQLNVYRIAAEKMLHQPVRMLIYQILQGELKDVAILSEKKIEEEILSLCSGKLEK